MKSTFGAPFGARAGSGHAGSDSSAVRPMTPGKTVSRRVLVQRHVGHSSLWIGTPTSQQCGSQTSPTRGDCPFGPSFLVALRREQQSSGRHRGLSSRRPTTYRCPRISPSTTPRCSCGHALLVFGAALLAGGWALARAGERAAGTRRLLEHPPLHWLSAVVASMPMRTATAISSAAKARASVSPRCARPASRRATPRRRPRGNGPTWPSRRGRRVAGAPARHRPDRDHEQARSDGLTHSESEHQNESGDDHEATADPEQADHPADDRTEDRDLGERAQRDAITPGAKARLR